MFCPNCGKELSDQAVTCPGCGHPLRPRSDPPAGPRARRAGPSPSCCASCSARSACTGSTSGKVGTGIAMIFTLGGLGIWVLVDLIMIITGSFTDIDGKVLLSWEA